MADEYDDKPRISDAPLHLAWKTTTNIPLSKLEELVNKGLEIDRGRYSPEEDKRLRKNWRRICRRFQEFSDPFIAFGLKTRPKELVPDPQSDDECPKTRRRIVKRLYKNCNILLRMAYKLDNRLICDIYSRCKRLFCHTKFKYSKASQVPKPIKEAAWTDLNVKKEANREVGSKMSIAPFATRVIKCQIEPGQKPHRHRWKLEDDLMLEAAIESQAGKDSASEVPLFKIDWSKVEADMRRAGSGLTKSKLYKRWYTTHRHLANQRCKCIRRTTTTENDGEE